jgi:hypothetical protein
MQGFRPWDHIRLQGTSDGSRPAHRPDPTRPEVGARPDDRPRAPGAHGRRSRIHLARTTQPGQGPAAGQPPTRRLRLGACQSRRLLHQDSDGASGPADENIRRNGQGVRQRLPAPAVAGGDGVRHRQAVHLPVPRLDIRQHRQTGRVAGPRGLPGHNRQVRRFDRASGHRIRRISLGGTRSGRHPGHRGTPGTAGRRARLVGHRPVVSAG